MCANRTTPHWPWRLILVTGIDTAGKSTAAQACRRCGYHVVHSPYHPEMVDVTGHYRSLLETAAPWTVFDRGFITEHVYGPVLRGRSRLQERQFQELVDLSARRQGAVLYLEEPDAVLLPRLEASLGRFHRHRLTLAHLGALRRRYEEVLASMEPVMPVYRLQPSRVALAELGALLHQTLGTSGRRGRLDRGGSATTSDSRWSKAK